MGQSPVSVAQLITGQVIGLEGVWDFKLNTIKAEKIFLPSILNAPLL